MPSSPLSSFARIFQGAHSTSLASVFLLACVYGATLLCAPSRASACCQTGLPAYHRVQFDGDSVIALNEIAGSGLRFGRDGERRFPVSNLTRRTDRFLSPDGEQIAIFKANYGEYSSDCLPDDYTVEIRRVRDDHLLTSFPLAANDAFHAWFAEGNRTLVIHGYRYESDREEAYIVDLADGSVTTRNALRAGVTRDDHLVTMEDEGLVIRPLHDLEARELMVRAEELNGVFRLLPGALQTRDHLTFLKEDDAVSLLTVERDASGFRRRVEDIPRQGSVVSSDASAEFLVVMGVERTSVSVIGRSGVEHIRVSGQAFYTAAAIAPDASALVVVSVTEPEADISPLSYAFERSATELIFPSGRVVHSGRAQRSQVQRITRSAAH